MNQKDDFVPEWHDDSEIKPGLYIWPTYIHSCSIKDREKEKPYLLLNCEVEDFEKKKCPESGFKFDTRIYLTDAAKRRCVWFLGKFGYSDALFRGKTRPIIRAKEIEGLHGQFLIEVKMTDSQMLQIDVKAFESVDGDLTKTYQKALDKAKEPGDEQGSIDLEADVKNGKKPAHARMDPEDPLSSFE